MTQPVKTFQAAPLDVRKLAGDVLLLAWNGEEPPARGLRAMAGGEEIRPPASHTTVPLGAGRFRNFMAVRRAEVASSPDTITVCDNTGHTLAEAASHPHGRSRTPDLDPAGLLAGLDGAARVRTIRFVTDLCGSIFQLGANAEFIANCQQLIGEISRSPGTLLPRCTVLDDYVLCTGTLKAAMGERLSAVFVGPCGVRRAANNPVILRGSATRQGLVAFAILLEKSAVAAGANVVILAENGMACRQIGEGSAAVPVLEWIATAQADTAAARGYLLDCLARLAPRHPHAASLLRELQVVGTRDGRVVNEKACPISAGADLILLTRAGIFASGWLRDPHGIVAAVELEMHGRSLSVPADRLIRFAHRVADLRRSVAPSDIYSGFAAFAPSENLNGGVCRLALRLHSGGRIRVAEGPSILPPAGALEAVLTAIPQDQIDATVIAECIEPVVAALRTPTNAPDVSPRMIEFGRLPAPPSASVIVPMTADIDIVRCRTGMFATDPAMAGVETVYVLDQAQQRSGAERLLRALHMAYGTPMRVVVVGHAPSDDAAALNAAAKLASAALLVFVGPSVLPETTNWVGALASFLTAHPRCGLVGTRLVREDHSLAAAGVEFGMIGEGRWDSRRLYHGFPSEFAAASSAAPVPALPFGCLAIRRSMFELVGGFAEDYFTALRTAADLSMRVRTHGFEVWRAAAPILFDFDVEERLTAPDTRAELDRRLLEKRWRTAADSQVQSNDRPAPSRSRIRPQTRTRRRRRAA